MSDETGEREDATVNGSGTSFTTNADAEDGNSAQVEKERASYEAWNKKREAKLRRL